ncbi:MAG: ABC transporter ATP-binding protein [Treponema sp.]
MSVAITIQHARKAYGTHVVIPDISLAVQEGEFFTLLGPSGCGKTTLLKMIAGFSTFDAGSCYFNDTKINDVDPAKRNIGMVFQNAALFPHLNVRQNVAFGLKTRQFSKTYIAEHTEHFLKLMHLDHTADQLPDKLSGGQQQRAALARALCIEPDVLLMDEPLSHLDAKLRVEMRTLIKNMQRTLNITTLYVTHDQEEAMAISNRIAVMKDGIIQQAGSPQAIYQRPANTFVASFIGQSNILAADLVVQQGQTYISLCNHTLPPPALKPAYQKEQPILVSIRPEQLFLQAKGSACLHAVVEDSVFLGLNTHYRVRLNNGTPLEAVQRSSTEHIIPTGTEVGLAVDTENINLFTASGDTNICAY